jgi:hypothetical protein
MRTRTLLLFLMVVLTASTAAPAPAPAPAAGVQPLANSDAQACAQPSRQVSSSSVSSKRVFSGPCLPIDNALNYTNL